MSTNAYDSVLAPPTDGELAPPEDRTLLGRTKEIAITIDDIQAFPLNPRQSDNPRFDEIMASIEVILRILPVSKSAREVISVGNPVFLSTTITLTSVRFNGTIR